MEQVDQKLGDAFDVIDLTEEEVRRRQTRINWNLHSDRMAFFTALAKNIADHVEFIRRPVSRKPVHTPARVLDDLQHIMKVHGKEKFEQALKRLKYGRIPSNAQPETTGR